MHHDNCIAFFRYDPVTKSDVHGKRYEAEKASHGGPRDNERSASGQFTASLSGEDLRLSERTSEKIAAETNTSRSFVENAERFAKGVDAAEAVVPGIRTEILSGSLKAKRDDVAAIARAAPEDRAELAEQLRQPKTPGLIAAEQAGQSAGIDPELLMKVLTNPEMAKLLKALAGTIE